MIVLTALRFLAILGATFAASMCNETQAWIWESRTIEVSQIIAQPWIGKPAIAWIQSGPTGGGTRNHKHAVNLSVTNQSSRFLASLSGICSVYDAAGNRLATDYESAFHGDAELAPGNSAVFSGFAVPDSAEKVDCKIIEAISGK